MKRAAGRADGPPLFVVGGQCAPQAYDKGPLRSWMAQGLNERRDLLGAL